MSACLFGRQVGLLAVRLLYRFYVCVHLSKWFTFFSFLVVCSLLSGRFTLAGNCRVYETLGIAGFVFIRRHKRRCGAERLSNHLCPNVLYTMLAVRCLFLILLTFFKIVFSVFFSNIDSQYSNLFLSASSSILLASAKYPCCICLKISATFGYLFLQSFANFSK